MNYLEKAIKAVIEKEEDLRKTNISKLKNFYFESDKLANIEVGENFTTKMIFTLKYNSIIISYLVENLSNHLVGYLNFYDSHIKHDFHVKYEVKDKEEKEIERVIKEWKEKFPRLNIDHVIADLDKLVTVDTSELNVNSFHGIFHTREEF